MTLALLLTAVTGAWATDPNTVIWYGNEATWKGWTGDVTTHTVGDITITCSGNAQTYEHKNFSGRPLVMDATTGAITFTSNGAPFTSIKIKMYDGTDPGLAGWTWDNGYNVEWSGTPSTSVTLSGCDIKADVITFTTEPPIVVEPGEAANTWTFTQPGSDVVLTPLYAPTAKWATKDTGSETKTLLPEAAEGVIAGTDAPLIAEGTGIVATTTIGETPTAQGTVMYAVTSTKVTDASELIPSDWKNTVPTAKIIADNGGAFKVWYYILGADAPQGEAATLDNTFNNSDIASLTVTVLSNKFDLTLKAANVNTIDATDASKGTVTVKEGTGAAVDKTGDITDEGKLKAIKMGSEVKLNTKAGYKFRKVEVKKKVEKTITVGEQNYTVQDGETWSQFITRQQSGWDFSYNPDGWLVRMYGTSISTLYVSSDGITWDLLKLTSQDAPIDTDKQYKWN